MSTNPLSEEQIDKINEIAKLPPEKQKEEFSKFLQTLNEEQVEFLRNQQTQTQCLFCSIINGQINSYKIYEDEKVMGVLDINPASDGHAILFPKQHFQFLGELNEELNGHMFNIANKISSKIVEKLNAKGVTIYVANGFGAGQVIQHISVNIIPRYDGDKISFKWQAKKAGSESLEKISKELKMESILEMVKEKIFKPEVVKIKKFFQRIP